METTGGSSRGQARRLGPPPAARAPSSSVDPATTVTTSDSVAGGRYRAADIDGLTVRTDMPDHLPVSAAEADLVRIYFADLIDAVLKDSA